MSSKHDALVKSQKFVNIILSNGREQRVPEKYKNMSSQAAVIRAMTKDGLKMMQIAAVLDIRPQQVRNQLLQSNKK